MAGAVDPALAAKTMDDGREVKLSVPTVNDTGIVMGELVVPVTPIWIFPKFVLPAASPRAFAEIVIDNGVLPLPGVTVSQLPPEALAVKGSIEGLPPASVAEIWTVVVAGVVDPNGAFNWTDAGKAAARATARLYAKCTPISDLFPLPDSMMMRSVYVCPTFAVAFNFVKSNFKSIEQLLGDPEDAFPIFTPSQWETGDNQAPSSALGGSSVMGFTVVEDEPLLLPSTKLTITVCVGRSGDKVKSEAGSVFMSPTGKTVTGTVARAAG